MALIATLLVVGAILLMLETVLPGMIAGLIGVFCLIAGVVLGYTEYGARTGSYILAGVVLGLVAGFTVWLRLFPNSPIAKRLVSQRTIGDVASEKPELLGLSGSALSALRPSGTALIDGRRVDVVSEGGHIERGTPLKVVAVEGLRVVVRAHET